MDDSTGRKICQLVAGIIITDDILHDKEEAFLDRVLARFGIKDGSRDVIFPLVDKDEAVTEIRGLPKQAQDDAFGLLVEAACVDGEVVPEEREYLTAIAGALAISTDDLEKRIASQLKS